MEPINLKMEHIESNDPLIQKKYWFLSCQNNSVTNKRERMMASIQTDEELKNTRLNCSSQSYISSANYLQDAIDHAFTEK